MRLLPDPSLGPASIKQQGYSFLLEAHITSKNDKSQINILLYMRNELEFHAKMFCMQCTHIKIGSRSKELN